MTKQVMFVTGNEYKFQAAREGVSGYGVELVRVDLETPEIQADTVEEVAAFSASWAADKLGQPVVLTDGGYYIEALNGFPGVFIKYINKWLSAADLLRLMNGKTNRRVTAKVALAYCKPGDKPEIFAADFAGEIARVPGKSGGTSINEIYIPYPYDKTESEIARPEMIKYWNGGNIWGKWCEWMGFGREV